MDLWSYHDAKLRELKKLYDRTSLNIRNRIQELIDTFNFNKETIFNITDNKTKKRIDAYIEKWEDDGLLTGYFGILAKKMHSRIRVKNSEILELLIYGAYIEEQNKHQEKEMQIFKDSVSYYYSQGINEVRKAKKQKPLSYIIPDVIFLYLIEQINSMGYTWKQYIDSTIINNANQINRQVLINLQQQKELKMDSDEFKILFDRQNKQKLNINGEKISGAVDIELIGLNNQAKIKGIEREDSNAKVRFLAVTDGKSTEMCQSMNNMEFYINKENEFYRMYGESKSELRNYRIKCKGLILGINLPPISHHWHWCRSTITYIIDQKQYKDLGLKYKDVTNQFLNKKRYKVIEEQYYIAPDGNKYYIDGKNVIMKHTKKEKEVAKILGEMYGGKVELVPAVLNPKGVKTPDYIIKGEKYDLKEPEGSSSTTIYDLFKHKSKQADNFIIDIHKSGLDRIESIEQSQKIFYSSHRKWIKTIILMEDNEIFKVLKRR